MNLLLLIYGFSIFLICLLTHILIWRLKRPLRDALILFVIFIFIPMAALISLIFLRKVVGFINLSSIEIIMILFFHLSLSAVYIASYPAVQAISPSLDILLVIISSKSKKMTGEDLLKNYNDTELVAARVNDLTASVLVSQKDDCFELTHIGKIIIVLFILYRKILGLPIGKG